MVEVALEPCPFCGGKALLWEKRKPKQQLVWCANSVSCGAIIELHDDDMDAITAWNTRHRTAADERVKALEAALRPFARAVHISGDVSGDCVKCILSYPADADETFCLADLEAARRAIGEG